MIFGTKVIKTRVCAKKKCIKMYEKLSHACRVRLFSLSRYIAAHRDIGFDDVSEKLAQGFLREGGYVNDLPCAAGKIGDETVGGVEMCVLRKLRDPEAMAERFEGSGFENAGVRFVEKSADGIGENWC